jgi:acetylornithine/succinyldiaminopimelate/putrescine aminotransferase
MVVKALPIALYSRMMNDITATDNQWSDNFFAHVAQTSDSPIGLQISHARGSTLYTTDGGEYTDFISGIAVSSLGHCHPDVVKAIHDQVDKHLHVMVYGEFIQGPQSDFAGLLAAQLPKSLQRIYFVNSGTEANEGALKLAKKYTGRSRMIAFRNSYHGDTHGALSVTGRDVYRDPFLPLLPDVHFLDFNSFDGLDAIDTSVAAVILEPIQGEGGIIQADQAWLTEVRKRCTETGALLIFDEIQSGFGRTGSLFVFMQYGVIPDILTMAKAMGGGMPIGGFASSDAIFKSFTENPPLCHVTTFGGHPVSCAAGHAALHVLLRDNLSERARHIELRIREQLQHPLILEIRGRGCMLGLSLSDYETTRRVVESAFEHHVLLVWTLHSNTLIRIAPPLTITDGVLDATLRTLRSALDYAQGTIRV